MYKKTSIILIALLVIIITILHYTTPTMFNPLHELYQVLYFIPIIFSAFALGFKGALAVSMIITFLYLPHVMFQWGGPFLMNLSRFLMIVLYNALGGLTGYLWQRERTEKQRYQLTAEKLEQSLSRLRQATDELANIENQLRTAERLSILGELTASLAHEVRNPLGSIRGVAEILRDESNHRDKKFIDILIKETERLDAVVANYLSFARTKTTEREWVSVDKLIHSITALVGPEMRKKQLNINFNIQPASLELYCDENQMRQVLLNILLNAIQASPPGAIIEFAAQERGDHIKIIIKDQGPGLSEEASQHLFEPFYTTKPEGTGLGLAITKRIIEHHNAKIYPENSAEGLQIIIEFLKPDKPHFVQESDKSNDKNS